MAKVFTYSIRTQVKAIYFENVSFQKLQELKRLLSFFKQFAHMIEPLRQASEAFKSERLRSLVRYREESGMMPFLEDAIREFEQLVVWKKAAGGAEDIPEPR
jgi:DNA mismatch repair protein MSH6